MYGGGYFDQVNKEIGLSEESYMVLAHELGHAHLDQSLLGRIMQHPSVRILGSPLLSTISGLGAGLLMAKGKGWGILLPTALSAPTLLSEYLATKIGGKKLEELGASEEHQKEYRSFMRPAFLSYLVSPVLSTLVAASMAR